MSSDGRWRSSALCSRPPLYIGARPGVDGGVLRWVCRAVVLLLPPAFIWTTTTRRAARTASARVGSAVARCGSAAAVRVVLVAGLLGGCGRIGFDEVPADAAADTAGA